MQSRPNLSTASCAETLTKLGLKFNGQNGHKSLLEFLERVEELQRSRGISDEQLYASAYELFEPDMKIWFRQNRTRVTSWPELVNLLKTSFLPHRYDSEIYRELNNLYQLPNENVSVFIAKSENLFARLTKVPSEDDRTAHIREHLLPFFITQTADKEFQSIQELDDICIKLEKSRLCVERAGQVSRSYNPSRGNKPPLCAELTDSTPAVSRCWNCGKPSHRFSECKVPQQNKFCYRCGKANTTVHRCPRCSKNANGQEGRGILQPRQ